MATREELSLSFGGAVDAYEAGRPDYPAQAVRWMLEPVAGPHPHVVDVGAGTGKLTRVLVAAGAHVQAVDPDAAMLEKLRQSVPGVPVTAGTAEALPLVDASVDAVVLGQAWHWVDPVPASTETARVLRPGGVLGLIWNVRDEREAWVHEMSLIVHGSAAERMLSGPGPTVAAPFGPLQERTWEWGSAMTRTRLWQMMHSRSYIITADAGERAHIDARLAELFDRIGVVGEQTVTLPYVTRAFRAQRP